MLFRRTFDPSAFKESFFLFGPRQVGKTHLLKKVLTADLYIDLLREGEYLRYAKDISLFSKEVGAGHGKRRKIVIDEIQRHPPLLNEVHALMEEDPAAQFIMSGSSARKLRRGGVNLLGGRAVTFRLHPLTHEEIGEAFSLEEVLQFGSLPRILAEPERDSRIRLLTSYVETYLKEEIQQEALTRNVPAFARFLELAAFENGHILNFKNLSREVGVDAKTVKEYFQILEDTLIGFFLYPVTRSERKKLVAHPKFYFFDPGVVRALRNELNAALIPASPPFGDAFEHWLILEMKKILDYRGRAFDLLFFGTNDGAEVDVILEQGKETWAVEIKATSKVRGADLRVLQGFRKDHNCRRAVCVSLTPRPYREGPIDILPWKDFLKEL